METRLEVEPKRTRSRTLPVQRLSLFGRRRSDGRPSTNSTFFIALPRSPSSTGNAGFQKVLQIVEVPRDRRGDAPTPSSAHSATAFQ